jgi:hypothetical protein
MSVETLLNAFLDQYNTFVTDLLEKCQTKFVGDAPLAEFESFASGKLSSSTVCRFMLVAASSLGLVTVGSDSRVQVNTHLLEQNYSGLEYPINIFVLFDFQLTREYNNITATNAKNELLKSGLIAFLWTFFCTVNKKKTS